LHETTTTSITTSTKHHGNSEEEQEGRKMNGVRQCEQRADQEKEESTSKTQ
jgi:hypothetical protein